MSMAFFRNKNKNIFVRNDPKTLHKNLEFTATEQYKILRANLSFTIPEDVKCPIIGVTSSVRGEGKSTTAVNLSYVLAENGKKVLLIDGDLRIPSIAKKMMIESTPGLTNLLMRFEPRQLISFQSNILDNWYIMPAGNIPPNPSELLGSSKMEKLLKALSDEFDYIIIDLPPVNIVSDALAVSHYVTGLILVVREDYTERKEFEACSRQLELSNIKVLGCVINGAQSGTGYYSRYRKSYKKYKYYKNDKDERNN